MPPLPSYNENSLQGKGHTTLPISYLPSLPGLPLTLYSFCHHSLHISLSFSFLHNDCSFMDQVLGWVGLGILSFFLPGWMIGPFFPFSLNSLSLLVCLNWTGQTDSLAGTWVAEESLSLFLLSCLLSPLHTCLPSDFSPLLLQAEAARHHSNKTIPSLLPSQ